MSGAQSPLLHRTQAASLGQHNSARTEAHWLTGWGTERATLWQGLSELMRKQYQTGAVLVATEQWRLSAVGDGMNSEQRCVTDHRGRSALEVAEMLTDFKP